MFYLSLVDEHSSLIKPLRTSPDPPLEEEPSEPWSSLLVLVVGELPPAPVQPEQVQLSELEPVRPAEALEEA